LAAALLTDEGLFSGPEESASLTRSSSSEQSASLTRSSSSEQSADLTRAVVVGGLIVDMDGTLVDSHAVVRQVWSSWANSQGLDPAEVVSYSTGRRPEATLKHFAPDDPDPQSTTARLEEQEVSLTEPITEVPGARALLTSLMAEDEPESPERPVVALVTSATRRLAQVRMEAARVPFPQVAVCGEDVPQGKPAPDGYLAAAGALGVPITDCLVLEDAPAGVAGALAAGAKLIVVGGEAGQPDHPNQLAAVQDLTGIRARRLPDGRIELTYPAVRT
jgi:sugar-phosphatase